MILNSLGAERPQWLQRPQPGQTAGGAGMLDGDGYTYGIGIAGVVVVGGTYVLSLMYGPCTKPLLFEFMVLMLHEPSALE